MGRINYKLFHNTVHLYGNQTNIGSSESISVCLLITTIVATGTDLRNNIFYNELRNNISGNKTYTVYVPSGYTFSTINYNYYDASGSNRIFGFYGADKTTLSDWRTSIGQEDYSINIQPYFISDNNLYLTGQTMEDSGF